MLPFDPTNPHALPLQVIPHILETIPQAVFWRDQAGVYQGGNTRFAQDVGLSQASDIIGKTPADLPPSPIASYLHSLVVAEPVPQQDVQLPSAEGEEAIWLRLSLVPLSSAAGEPAGSFGMYEHITAAKSAEAKLQWENDKLLATLESLPDGIFVETYTDRSYWFNQSFVELWKLPGSHGSTDISMIMPLISNQIVDVEPFLARMAEVRQDPLGSSVDLLSFKDGRIFERYSRPHRIGEAVIGRVWSFRDITDRVNLESQVREVGDLYRLLIDRMLDGVIMVEEAKLTLVNGAFARMLGYTVEEMSNQPFQKFIAPEAYEMVAERHRLRMSGVDMPEDYEASLLHKDGTTRIHAVLGLRLTTVQGRPVVFGTIKDITERKQAEIERERHHEQLIEAQQAALRELSTPLIPISDDVVIMPLIGSVDSRRAQQVLETLLEGIAGHSATFAILDITGVAVVDTQVANALIRAAQAVKLLGATVILTGIRPEVAQTLIGLGVDLKGIIAHGSLQTGIAYALQNG